MNPIETVIDMVLNHNDLTDDEHDACIDVLRNLDEDYLAHYGVRGMKKGIRRWTNEDGTLTEAGKEHYGLVSQKRLQKDFDYSRRREAANYAINEYEFKKMAVNHAYKFGKNMLKAPKEVLRDPEAYAKRGNEILKKMGQIKWSKELVKSTNERAKAHNFAKSLLELRGNDIKMKNLSASAELGWGKWAMAYLNPDPNDRNKTYFNAYWVDNKLARRNNKIDKMDKKTSKIIDPEGYKKQIEIQKELKKRKIIK